MPATLQKFSQKNFNYFFLLNILKNISTNFSHAIDLRYKFKNGILKSIWYAKPLGQNRCEAILETLTQELYRLIDPHQPKTRRAISIKTGTPAYYVLSKEIPKFKGFFLSPENYQKILNNSITGLAATQVLALWLNEIDFKTGNVGIDQDGRIIKIDGGLSLIKLNPKFKHLYEGKNLDITQVDLEALPNLQTYEACNWLHHIQWNLQKGAMKEDPTPLDKAINQSPYFKQELYQTILRITSLPDELILFFTQNYIANPTDVTILSKFIIARKEQLKEAAEQIPAFKEYRQSNLARKDMFDFFNYLKTFKTMRKFCLLSEFKNEYKVNIKAAIFGNVIKEYTRIENFAIELDNYLWHLNSPIGLYTKKFSRDILSVPEQKKINKNIESLKKILKEYFSSPTIDIKDKFYKKLNRIKKDLQKETKSKNLTTLSFILSINKVLAANDDLKNKTTQALPSMAFFNKTHQKVSTTAYNQHEMDIHTSNFAL